MGIDSDLIRGHIDTIILKILFSGDKYGYEICKEVEERSSGTYELKQPTLYSCLKRLEDKGFISSYWEDSDIGGKRHYYKLTDSGIEEYKRNQEEWIRSRSIIDDLISYRQTDVQKLEQEVEEQKDEDLTVVDGKTSDFSPVSVDKLEEEPIETNSETGDFENTEVVNDAQEESPTEQLSNEEETSFDQETAETDNEPANQPITENTDKQETLSSGESEVKAEDDQDNTTSSDLENITIDDNYDIMSILGHYDNSQDHAIEQNIDDLESAQNILDNFDKKYNLPDEDQDDQEKIDNLINATDSEQETANDVALATAAGEPEANNGDEKIVSNEEFNLNDYLNEETYFDDTTTDQKSFVSPSIIIDGIENRAENTNSQDQNLTPAVHEEKPAAIREEKPIEEPHFDQTPSYVNFNDDETLNNVTNSAVSNDDDMYVDDSNIDYNEIYINPEEQNNQDDAPNFVFDDENVNKPIEDSTHANDYVNPNDDDGYAYGKNYDKYNSSNYNTSNDQDDHLDDYASSNASNFDTQTSQYTNQDDDHETFTPKYTDEEYKQLLSQLDNVQNSTVTIPQDKKIELFNADSINRNINKDYADLKKSLSEEGFSVKPYYATVKEVNDEKNYIQSNKIRMVQSWISFSFITLFLLVAYAIVKNSQSPVYTYGLKFTYFLIGIGLAIIVPAIYTTMYIVNPYKKHMAKYVPRISYVLSILLTIQLLILVYCLNLQFGFYSFRQENFNHLLWIIPGIISFYPILQTIVYHILYRSKRFHI